MKESNLLLFLFLLLTIETDVYSSIVKRKHTTIDRCHRMQVSHRCPSAGRTWHFDVRSSECRTANGVECGALGNRFRSKEDCEKICIDKCREMEESRLCPGTTKLWHYDIRASECRNSNEAQCGAVGNRFVSKEDCENTCAGNLNISARQADSHSHDIGHGISNDDPRHWPGLPGIGWDPCCHNKCPGHDCNRQCCPGCGRPQCNRCPECDHRCPPRPPPRPPCALSCTRPCPHPCPNPCPPCEHPGGCCDHDNHQQPGNGISPCSVTGYGAKSSVHCPTVCSSSRLSPQQKSSHCGCRTGTIIRPPCSSQRCDYSCRNTTGCKNTTTDKPTAPEPKPTGPALIPPGVICPIDDPEVTCGMRCEFGFKKTSAGCPYCECEENFKSLLQGLLPREFGRYCSNIRTTCRLDCPQGFAKDRYGCDICQCIQSGLASSKDCSLKPRCTMPCEHGYQKGPDGCEICLCNHDSRY